jgi:uncharacterized membrane protein YeaQ/YmgE (transglycosylase-associated protein family)
MHWPAPLNGQQVWSHRAINQRLRPTLEMNMGILSWIVLGLVAGALAKWLMPGKDGGGWLITMALGIGGAFVGGYLGSLLGIGGSANGVNIGSIVTATVGAVVLLFVYRMVKK